ncbi:pirin family protein [Parasynechococcus sp.]|uniref:pirin family protein n=1 Tax=Parasynechococcus sp. TaxID=3101203 RepID=UPI003703D928
MILRPADQRFHSQLDWLDSWHSFNQDPNWMGFGPLRVINDDIIGAGKGFGMHSYRDMEIITVMVEGALTDADSMGNNVVLRAGEVQRMSAGSGIVHSEINQTGEPCRLLQIWIEPAQLGIQPADEQKPFAIGEGWTPLIEPDASGEAAMAIERRVRLWRAQPQRQQPLPLPAAKERLLWIQVIDRELTLNSEGSPEQSLPRGDGLGLIQDGSTQGELVSLGERADVLLFALA